MTIESKSDPKSETFLFTSESVTEGHPDKICDQISDAILDHFLEQDPYARVRAECAVSTSILFIAALPILDTVTVMVRRKRSGRSIFAPDKLHLHHILLQFFNGNVRRTVSWMALLQTGFSVTGIALAESSQQRYTLILFVIMLAIFYILLSDMIARQNKFAYHRKKRRKR